MSEEKSKPDKNSQTEAEGAAPADAAGHDTTASQGGPGAEANGADAKPQDDKDAVRAEIRELKAELKNIANKMVRVRNIGEQNTLKNDQRTKQRQLMALQSKLKRL